MLLLTRPAISPFSRLRPAAYAGLLGVWLLLGAGELRSAWGDSGPEPSPFGPWAKTAREAAEKNAERAARRAAEISAQLEQLTTTSGELSQASPENSAHHPWQCRAGQEPLGSSTLREEYWRADSARQVLDDTFPGCFQAQVKPDNPQIAPVCIPTWVGPIKIEYCVDPPGAFAEVLQSHFSPSELAKTPLGSNCCPQNPEFLQLCGAAKINRGFLLTHWWPEQIAEIQQYGIAAFDPLWEKGNDTYRDSRLRSFLKSYSAHTSDPGAAENTAKQAHVYRSYLASLAMVNNEAPRTTGWRGFKNNCQCFYATLNSANAGGAPRKIVSGWTEEEKYLPYWRNSQLWSAIDREFRYSEMTSLADELSPLASAARTARRAFLLFSTASVGADSSFVPPQRRVNKFADSIDKLQRIYPGANNGRQVGECFRVQDIPDIMEQQPGANWRPDLLGRAQDIGTGGPLDDIRFSYWNRRRACMCPQIGPLVVVKLNGAPIYCEQVQPACRSVDEGDWPLPPDDQNAARLPIQPPPAVDGIPWPFLPGVPGIAAGSYPLANGERCQLRQGGQLNKESPEEKLKCRSCGSRCQ